MAKYSKLQVIATMKETGMVPVFYHADPETARQVLKACYDGGVRAFEFTNRGDFAQEVFKELVKYADRELPGMILGVPTFAVIYFLVKTFVEFKLKENNMPIQTSSYTMIKRMDPETMNSEYIIPGISKREQRKKNIFEDDVSREVAIAARMSRVERDKKGKQQEELLDSVLKEGISKNKDEKTD